MHSNRVYECNGCGSEVSILDVVWLPEDFGRPYCSQECQDLLMSNIKAKILSLLDAQPGLDSEEMADILDLCILDTSDAAHILLKDGVIGYE